MNQQADGIYLIFEHGERVQGQPGRLNYVIEKFNEYAVRMEEQDTIINLNQSAVTSSRLWGSTRPADIAELQRRFSIPFSVLLLSFIGIPLAQQQPRGGVYGNILVGFLIYFSYSNLIRVSHIWVINEIIPSWLGGLAANVLLILVGLILLIRWYGWQWLTFKLKGILRL